MDAVEAVFGKGEAEGMLGKDAEDGGGDAVCVVGKEEVLVGVEGEAFGTDGGGDDGYAGGHGFDDFDAGAAAGAEGDDHEAAAPEVLGDVGDGAGEFDAAVGGGELLEMGWRVAADDEEFRGGDGFVDAGQDVATEPGDGVLIGEPVHGAEECDEG